MNKDIKIIRGITEFSAGIGAGAVIMAVILYVLEAFNVLATVMLALAGVAIIIGCLGLECFTYNLERRRKLGCRKNI